MTNKRGLIKDKRSKERTQAAIKEGDSGELKQKPLWQVGGRKGREGRYKWI